MSQGVRASVSVNLPLGNLPPLSACAQAIELLSFTGVVEDLGSGTLDIEPRTKPRITSNFAPVETSLLFALCQSLSNDERGRTPQSPPRCWIIFRETTFLGELKKNNMKKGPNAHMVKFKFECKQLQHKERALSQYSVRSAASDDMLCTTAKNWRWPQLQHAHKFTDVDPRQCTRTTNS